MTDAELLSVGRLARRTGLTAKALRHYDRIDLLRPAHVDDAGYRWYSPVQVARARRIAILRDVDRPRDPAQRSRDDSGPAALLVITDQSASSSNRVSWSPAGADSRALSEFQGVRVGAAITSRPRRGQPVGRGRGVRDLEPDPDLAGHPPPDLDVVDVLGVRRVHDLEGRAPGVEQRHVPAGRLPHRELVEPERVAVEAHRGLVVGRGHDEAEFADIGHGGATYPCR